MTATARMTRHPGAPLTRVGVHVVIALTLLLSSCGTVPETQAQNSAGATGTPIGPGRLFLPSTIDHNHTQILRRFYSHAACDAWLEEATAVERRGLETIDQYGGQAIAVSRANLQAMLAFLLVRQLECPAKKADLTLAAEAERLLGELRELPADDDPTGILRAQAARLWGWRLKAAGDTAGTAAQFAKARALAIEYGLRQEFVFASAMLAPVADAPRDPKAPPQLPPELQLQTPVRYTFKPPAQAAGALRIREKWILSGAFDLQVQQDWHGRYAITTDATGTHVEWSSLRDSEDGATPIGPIHFRLAANGTAGAIENSGAPLPTVAEHFTRLAEALPQIDARDRQLLIQVGETADHFASAEPVPGDIESYGNMGLAAWHNGRFIHGETHIADPWTNETVYGHVDRRLERRLLRELPCDTGGSQPDCVELYAVVTPHDDSLQRFIDAIRSEAPAELAAVLRDATIAGQARYTVVADPLTLATHRYRQSTRIVVENLHLDGRLPVLAIDAVQEIDFVADGP